MNRLICFAIALALAMTLISPSVLADDDASSAAIREAIRDYLAQANADIDHRVEIEIPRIDFTDRDCPAPEPFLPGSRARSIGPISVGLRCANAPQQSRYVRVDVQVFGQYLVAAHDIAPGTKLRPGDITRREGEITRQLSHLPADEAAAVGQQARRRIMHDTMIRKDMLEAPTVIRRNDPVKIVARGAGFAVSTRGTAMNDAAVGESVRVKTANGRILTLVADGPGSVTTGP